MRQQVFVVHSWHIFHLLFKQAACTTGLYAYGLVLCVNKCFSFSSKGLQRSSQKYWGKGGKICEKGWIHFTSSIHKSVRCHSHAYIHRSLTMPDCLETHRREGSRVTANQPSSLELYTLPCWKTKLLNVSPVICCKNVFVSGQDWFLINGPL